jgi:hypothetical protein
MFVVTYLYVSMFHAEDLAPRAKTRFTGKEGFPIVEGKRGFPHLHAREPATTTST